MTPDQFARMLAGAEVIAGRAQLPFDQLPVEEQERHRLTARSLLDAVVQSAPADRAESDALWNELHRRDTETDQPLTADRAADVASCPGRELDPNPCRCPCYGCKHHCAAHNPEELLDGESAPAETALRDRIAAAIWERQNPGRRYADCEHPWQADAEADADAVMAALFGPIPTGTDVATWTAIRAIQFMNEAGQQRDDAKAALLRELIDEAVECDGYVTVQELRRMARKAAPTAPAEVADQPSAAPAVSSVGQAAHTARSAEWRAAAAFVEAMNEGCGQSKPCASCDAREDAAAELRRMADEAQQQTEPECTCGGPISSTTLDSGITYEQHRRDCAVMTDSPGGAGEEPADEAQAVCVCGHPEQQHFEDVCIAECGCSDFLTAEGAAEERARAEAAIHALRSAAEQVRIGLAVGPIPLEVRPAVATWLRRLADQRRDRAIARAVAVAEQKPKGAQS